MNQLVELKENLYIRRKCIYFLKETNFKLLKLKYLLFKLKFKFIEPKEFIPLLRYNIKRKKKDFQG